MAEQIKFGDRLFLSGDKVVAQQDVLINRDLVVEGNLDVNGSITTIDTTNMYISDPIVEMNHEFEGSPVQDVGLEVNRGNEFNVFWLWDETIDSWSTKGTDLTVANLTATGDALINGTLEVDGQSTLASVNVEDLTNDRVVIVGIDGELEDDANFTFDGSEFNIGQGNFTVDVATGDVGIAGNLVINGQVTASSLNVEDLTNNRIVMAGVNGELEDDANFTFDAVEFNIGQGTFTVQQATGNTQVQGTLDVDSQTTLASANVEDLTNNRVVIVGPNGELEDDPNFVYDGAGLNIGLSNFLVQASSGDIYSRGAIHTDDQATFASTNVEDLTDNRVVISGPLGELEDDANFTFDGVTFDIGQGAFTVDVATGSTNANGQTTLPSLNVTDLTNDRIVIVGTNGELEDDANFTFDGTRFKVGPLIPAMTVDVVTSLTQLIGTFDVDGQSSLASANVEDLTDNRIVIAGASGELEDDANFTFDGTTFDIGTGNFTVDVASGDTYIQGDLEVQGSITTLNTPTLQIADNIVTLNSDYTGSTPNENVGFEVERGTLFKPVLRWNELSDRWEFTDDGVVYQPLSISVTDTGGDGSLTYDNTTGIITYTGPSPAEVRAHLSYIDNGGDGSFTYDDTTGVMTYTGPSHAEAIAHFTDGKGIQITDDGSVSTFALDFTEFDTSDVVEDPAATTTSGTMYFTEGRSRQSISLVDAGGDGSFTYDNTTGVMTYTGPSAAETRAHLSYVDAGGDGSFTYDNTTGVMTYTGPSPTEVRAHFSITNTTVGYGDLSYDNTTGVINYDRVTDADIRGSISVTTGLTAYDNTTGVITIPADTDDVPEANNLYFTEQRARDAFMSTANKLDLDYDEPTDRTNSVALTSVQSMHLFLDTNNSEAGNYLGVYNNKDPYVDSVNSTNTIFRIDENGDVDVTGNFTTITTDGLTEGTNLYYTDVRARSSVSAVTAAPSTTPSLTYDNTTGVFTYTPYDIDKNDYVRIAGDTMTGNLNFSDTGEGIVWSMNTDGASIKFYNTGDGDTDSRLEFSTNDNNNEYFRWTHAPSGGTAYESMRLVPNSDGDARLTLSGDLVVDASQSVDPVAKFTGTSSTADNPIIVAATNSDSRDPWIKLVRPTTTSGADLVIRGGAGTDWLSIHHISSGADSQLVVHSNGNVGVGTGTTTAPAEKLHVSGNIVATGDITAFYSDERLKDFDGRIDNALEKVSMLNGYYYTGNEVAAELGYDTETRQVGVSAQEVESVLPEVVKTAPISLDEETDYKTVQYEKLVPLLIESIKELKAEIEELKKK